MGQWLGVQPYREGDQWQAAKQEFHSALEPQRTAVRGPDPPLREEDDERARVILQVPIELA